MASIARKNLFEDIPRFLVAQAGIMFAVSLVTIQVGILNGFTRSTVRLIEQSEADLWVGSEEMVQFELTLPMPLERVVEAREVPGVQRAEPLLLTSGRWRGPDGKITPVRIFGFTPGSPLFGNWATLEGDTDALEQSYAVATDKTNLKSLKINQVSDTGTIGPLPAKVVALTADTQSIASSTFLFMSLKNAIAYSNAGMSSSVNCIPTDGGGFSCLNTFAPDPKSNPVKTPVEPRKPNLADPITYVLIQAKPEQNLEDLKQRLEKALPGTHAVTKAEMLQLTRDYWQTRTGIGFVLGLGAAVGMVVGMVVVSQILYSSVSDHLKEFGTLKAMGASDWVIYGVITEQALWMAVLGYLPSILLCMGLGSWTMASQGIMILISPATALGVFGITVAMCVGSALFAIQKVTHVDPAIVFKA